MVLVLDNKVKINFSVTKLMFSHIYFIIIFNLFFDEYQRSFVYVINIIYFNLKNILGLVDVILFIYHWYITLTWNYLIKDALLLYRWPDILYLRASIEFKTAFYISHILLLSWSVPNLGLLILDGGQVLSTSGRHLDGVLHRLGLL